MRSLIIQPSSGKGAREHYEDTILNPVPLSTIEPYVDEITLQRLREFYKGNAVPTWGFTPGKTGSNVSKWDKVEPGDVVLFLRNKEAFASAAVSMKTHNKELAARLWGYDDNNQTWEYVYFLDEVQQQKISYDYLNRMLEYSPKNNFQQSQVLDNENSDYIIQSLDMDSGTYEADVPSTEDYFNAIEPDEDTELDRKVKSKARTEQSYLRAVNFKGKKFAICGICKKEFPVSFLVAAHIKKRSECSEEEKRDYHNITMPMCRFGCDDLYEKGYIGVDGEVIAVADENLGEVVLDYLRMVDGNQCEYWHKDTKEYFDWHNERMKVAA